MIFCNKETENVTLNLFQWNTSKPVITVSRSVDCGLFAIANSTAIAFGENPTKLKFKQEALSSHLVDCFHAKKMSVFQQIFDSCNHFLTKLIIIVHTKNKTPVCGTASYTLNRSFNFFAE